MAFAGLCAWLGWHWTYRELINHPPEIKELLPLNNVLIPNDSTTITAIFDDPDGYNDIDDVSWSTDPEKGGTIKAVDSPQNNIAEFHAPPMPGAYTVYLTITDRAGKTDQEPITIYVGSQR